MIYARPAHVAPKFWNALGGTEADFQRELAYFYEVSGITPPA